MPTEQWLALMRLDKKASAGEIRFVVIDRPGSAVMRPAPDALVTEVIRRHSLPA
jgi:3-dehydroquinate synthase